VFHCPIQVRHRESACSAVRASSSALLTAAAELLCLRNSCVMGRLPVAAAVCSSVLSSAAQSKYLQATCVSAARGAVCYSQDRYICYTTQPQLG